MFVETFLKRKIITKFYMGLYLIFFVGIFFEQYNKEFRDIIYLATLFQWVILIVPLVIFKNFIYLLDKVYGNRDNSFINYLVINSALILMLPAFVNLLMLIKKT